MRVSWQWLSEWVDLSGLSGPQALADLLTARGLEVEEIRSLAEGLDHVVSVQILEKNPHPQSDRLSLCKVSLGSGDPLEIVCGAQNMKAGDKVVLAQIGANLPNGLKIQLSKIRGVTSNGMLCSEEELKLAETSEGILILPPDTPVGMPIAEILGLNDTILTLKLTANRGDCMGHLGIAREVAAATGAGVKIPRSTEMAQGVSPISVSLEAGALAPQFFGLHIKGVRIGPSPAWVSARLKAVGQRSINNVVDATNLVLLEMGHPVHAYDAAKLRGQRIGVRLSIEGEKLPLLDGGEVTLNGTELVVIDGEGPIGLAGVMGGGNSEVSDDTVDVFLECAEFAPVTVRKAAFRHQRRTEASLRFEKGIDPSGSPMVMSRLTALVQDLAGGTITGWSFLRAEGDLVRRPRMVEVTPDYFASFLGMSVTPDQCQKILTDLGCTVRIESGAWQVTPPSYRLDLNLREDLAEEIARTVGYDQIPSTVPPLSSSPSPQTTEAAMAALTLQDRAKDILAKAGLLETLNFGFSSRKWLEEFGWTGDQVGFRLLNPLSEEFEFLVPSLMPGIVQNALHHWRHSFGSTSVPIRLFELRPTFSGAAQSGQEMETGVQEQWKLALALAGPRTAGGLKSDFSPVDFFDLKAVLQNLFDKMGARGMRMQALSTKETSGPEKGWYHPGQSVEILAGNRVCGYAGLLHPKLAKQWKCREDLWIAEIDWTALVGLSRTASQSPAFKDWPAFPPMERDFALLVKSEVSADKIVQLALKAGKPLARQAKVFDVYRGAQVPEGMTSVAVRVIFYEDTRSLQEAEVEAASQQILQQWKKDLSAELRG